jgi:hypothetical protein
MNRVEPGCEEHVSLSVANGLAVLNAQLIAISTLKEVIIEIYEDYFGDGIIREMERYEWIVVKDEIQEMSKDIQGIFKAVPILGLHACI